MILASNRLRTSKYFCTLPNHCLCYHDEPTETALCRTNERSEMDHLRFEEKTYQNLLTTIFKESHQTIHLGTKNWYSDISSDDLLIEIKNARNIRAALGQIVCYAKAMKKNELKKSIIIFGVLPHKRELDIYIQVCEDLNIDLIYVELEDLIELRDYMFSNETTKEEVPSKLQKYRFLSR